MEVGFVHIGLMKTASSYMQTIWLRDASYCCSWKGNFELLRSLREAVKEGRVEQNLEIDIQTDTPYENGQKLVISNEGFSTAYMNEVNHQNKIPQFIDYASRHLGGFSQLSPNLLIVVRDPVSWIKSIYIQSIKEGGHGSRQHFIDHQLQFLKHSLDMEYILGCYKRYFNNIYVMPYETLKNDEDLFWKKISGAFGVPVVTERIDKAVNQSLGLKRVFLLSKLNELSSSLIRELFASQSYKNIQEKNLITENYSNHGKWVYRRFAEHAEEDALNGLYELFNLSESQEVFLDFQIPDKLAESIRAKYILPLKEHLSPELYESYEQELQNHASN